MKKKFAIFLSLVLSLFTMTTRATIFEVEPQICPTATAIKSVGVSHIAAQESNELWFTGRRNQKYDTSNMWTFIIGNIPASSVDDTYKKATKGLNSLSFQLGPIMGPVGKWICYYVTSEGYTAVTIYPAIADNKSSTLVTS